MGDFTIHKDVDRQKRYINRHIKNELKYWSHTAENLLTPSYYARYLLWQVDNMDEAVKYIENK